MEWALQVIGMSVVVVLGMTAMWSIYRQLKENRQILS